MSEGAGTNNFDESRFVSRLDFDYHGTRIVFLFLFHAVLSLERDMNDNGIPLEKVHRVTNKLRDSFGYISVAGMAIITVYAVLNLTPVWKKNLDEEQSSRSANGP